MTDQDTREQLEADVMNFCEHFYTTERRYNELIELLDRQAAITERECIDQRIADQIGAMWRSEKIRELEAERNSAYMPLPSDVDGKPIHVGDWMERIEFSATMPEVARCVAVTAKEVFYRGKNRVGDKPETLIKQNKASNWRRCLVNADGEVIRKGDFVYGADGRGWFVTGFDWEHTHPVCAEDAKGRTKQLKPSWCSHTCPDSFKRIADELREIGADTYRYSGTADLDVIADRIERLM